MGKRNVAIDVLRGFALLGILLMNIRSFSMPDIVYANPPEYGNEMVYNRLAYYVTYLFAHNKFMALFSMLFGASILLFTDKLASQGKSSLAYFARNFWLLLFGSAHLILIWSGDVLLVYAICAFPLYFARRIPARWQLGIGLAIFLLPVAFVVSMHRALPMLDEESQNSISYFWHLDESDIQDDLNLFRGPYIEQVVYRWEYETSLGDNTGEKLLCMSLWGNYFARALGAMLIGMAFFRWGIVTAQRSDRFYRGMLAYGFGFGIPLTLIGLEMNLYHEWNWEFSFFFGRIPNHIATLPIACGYIGGVMLWCKSPASAWLHHRLSEVGRTAFTCYIGQSIIATSIFYGMGLGLYGYVDYLLQLLIVVSIWLMQILLAWWWLSYFRQGPLEWIWRCLTYLKLQPLKISSNASDVQH